MSSMQVESVPIHKTSYDFRKVMSRSMAEAAEKAGCKIVDDKISIAHHGDTMVVNAAVSGESERPETDEIISFLYLSISNDDELSKQIPPGYYFLKADKQMSPTKNLTAALVDMGGKKVAEFPLNREIEAVDGTGGEPRGRPTVEVEASLHVRPTAARRRSRIIIHAHGIICYPNVWYWTWVVIVASA